METQANCSQIHVVRRSGESIRLRFQNMNTAWRDVIALGTICRFPKGHSERGMSTSGFFLLLKGSIQLTYNTEEGKHRIILYVGENTIFNDVPSITGDYPDVSFYCPEETEVCRFSPELLQNPDFVATHPQLFVNLVKSLAVKAALFFSTIGKTTFDSTTRQLCRILIRLHEEHCGMSQVDLAEILGVHPTTIARSVHTLRNEGIIGKFTKRYLEILNMAKLHEKAGR